MAYKMKGFPMMGVPQKTTTKKKYTGGHNPDDYHPDADLTDKYPRRKETDPRSKTYQKKAKDKATKGKASKKVGVPQKPTTKKKDTKGKGSLSDLFVTSGHTGKTVAARGPVNVGGGVKMQIKGRYESNYNLANAPSDIAKSVKKGYNKLKAGYTAVKTAISGSSKKKNKKNSRTNFGG